MKKKKNRKKLALISLSIISVISLCVAGTFSWVARSWTPSLEYSEISIATSGALIIKIDDDAYNDVNLNTLTGIHSYSLKQVSSSNGKNFVSADFNPILSGKSPVYNDEVRGKYIETTFHLQLQASNDTSIVYKKKVFIHPESFISYKPFSEAEKENTSESVSSSEEPSNSVESVSTPEEVSSSVDSILDDSYNVEKAIRIAVDVDGKQNAFIFCAKRGVDEDATGIYNDLKAVNTSPSTYNDVLKKPLFKDYNTKEQKVNEDVLTNQPCKGFNYYDGSDPSKTLFEISQFEAIKITLRIWLEGCDEYCVNEIAGKSLSLLLKFNCEDTSIIDTPPSDTETSDSATSEEIQ